MRRILPAMFAVLAMAACGDPDSAEPIASRGEPIANGMLDLEHESVFVLAIHEEAVGKLCTATLIAPNLLLTARHCISEGGDPQVICDVSPLTDSLPGSSIFATNDPRPGDDSPYFQGLDVRVPSEGDDTCGFDLALVVLSSNVPESVATPAVPRIDREVTEGETYSAVGYGSDADGNSTGSRMILSSLEVQCAPGECARLGGESTEFVGETGTCDGDSGGPAVDQDGKIVGVVSRSGQACELPVYGTVTAWRDFIVQNTLEAAELGGYEPPFWALSGSSDPPPMSGMEGTPCAAPSDCGEGLVCHTRSSAAEAVCRRTCSADAECDDGQSCQAVKGTSTAVCLEPSGGSADESCSMSARRAPASPLGVLAGVALMAGVARRRARARSERASSKRAAE